MNILVHGATGAQGGPVAAKLIELGHTVTAGVRNPQAYSAGHAIALDLDDVSTLTKAYEDADGVFVHLPLGSPDQLQTWAKTIAIAIGSARPARVVVSSSGYPVDFTAEHPSAIVTLLRGLEGSGVSTAVVAPRLYLENLLAPQIVGAVRTDGVLRYPLREDYAVSWSSHLDVADVAAGLFADTDITGVVDLGALPGLVGADLARSFGEHLGRDVRFEAQSPAEMGAEMAVLIGEEAIKPVVAMYTHRLTQPSDVIDESTSAQARLGIAPRSVSQWLADMGV